MCKEIQLINQYCTVCHYYDTILVAEAQRLSNNFCPEFTDEECITIYLWGIANQKYEVKAAYDFIVEYYAGWFPKLPGYGSFVKRVCNLAETFRLLAEVLLCEQELDPDEVSHLLDSMPIIVANESRSGTAKAAKEICNKGYCGSKDMYYYGVKLHSLAQKQHKTLPKPTMLWLTPASTHDLATAKDELGDLHDIDVFADKAYIDSGWIRDMRELNNLAVTTPVKLTKGQRFLNSDDKIYNSIVSAIRQPIDSFFNWIQQKTNIQQASKVRSTKGLIAFVFARIAACFLT